MKLIIQIFNSAENKCTEDTQKYGSKELELIKSAQDLLAKQFSYMNGKKVESEIDRIFLILSTQALKTIRATEVLLEKGYYGDAAALSRKIYEIAFMLRFFEMYPEAVLQWKNSEDPFNKGKIKIKEGKITTEKMMEIVGKKSGENNKWYKKYKQLSKFIHSSYLASITDSTSKNKYSYTPLFNNERFKSIVDDLIIATIVLTSFLRTKFINYLEPTIDDLNSIIDKMANWDQRYKKLPHYSKHEQNLRNTASNLKLV